MSLDFIEDELQQQKAQHLYRVLQTVQSSQAAVLTTDSGSVINLCSNNYLGLAERPELAEAASKAARDFGVGAGASRLVTGNMSIHDELECRLAAFEGTKSAIVFPTGYMANIGTIAALVGDGDIVFGDRLNHASLIDGSRLSGATFRVYRHLDLDTLESALRRASSFRRRLIVTDGVFSMDGDIAPLEGLVRLARQYDAITLVDEAHGTGTLGEHGRGASEACGVEDQIDVRVGTLSKALGCQGGFVTGSDRLIQLLRNRARTFIFTTGISPMICGAAIAALDILQNEPELRDQLAQNSQSMRRLLGMESDGHATPIIPIVIGDAEKCMNVAAALEESGFKISAIRPPTVPKGTSRLRVSVMATHALSQLEDAASAIKSALT